MTQTLKLNSAMLPIEIINWQQAVDLWMKGKADIIESYETIIKAGFRTIEMPANIQSHLIKLYDENLESWQSAMYMPAVIRMTDFIRPQKNFSIYKPFNRLNIWLRDNKKCQYCGLPISLNTFEYEHIIPQSRGGKSTWLNIVCACRLCNSRKANRTPEEAGMKLIRKPFAPIACKSYSSNVVRKFKALKNINNEQWKSYIYFNVELEE
jgi:5-methylcytosine-specific restriction endonuclease McrA